MALQGNWAQLIHSLDYCSEYCVSSRVALYLSVPVLAAHHLGFSSLFFPTHHPPENRLYTLESDTRNGATSFFKY